MPTRTFKQWPKAKKIEIWLGQIHGDTLRYQVVHARTEYLEDFYGAFIKVIRLAKEKGVLGGVVLAVQNKRIISLECPNFQEGPLVKIIF